VTHVSLVPAQLEDLLAFRGRRAAPEALQAILLGGGPIPAPLLQRARASGYRVLTTYGMSETASGVVAGGADAATLADPSAGRALPGVELRIEPDGTPDGSGEVLVRGAMVFAGYEGDTAATASALRDGWLHTGDIGTLDEAGLLRVLYRRDDLIISGGENVYPAEVEAVLAGHPAVLEAAVYGVPDARWGAVPEAAVVLAAGAPQDEELLRHCRSRLAGYKVPRRLVHLPELPRNTFGKVRRGQLRRRAQEAT
jgi:O-succinylbenzoic acid--CoA ligase